MNNSFHNIWLKFICYKNIKFLLFINQTSLSVFNNQNLNTMRTPDFISKIDELITSINEQQVFIYELLSQLYIIKRSLDQEELH